MSCFYSEMGTGSDAAHHVGLSALPETEIIHKPDVFLVNVQTL